MLFWVYLFDEFWLLSSFDVLCTQAHMIKNDEKTEMEHKYQWTYQLSKKCQVNNNHSVDKNLN